VYEYKNLPGASYEQFLMPPRERLIPEGQVPGDPKELSFEDAERLREERTKKSAERLRDKRANRPAERDPWGERPAKKKIDPWAGKG